MSTLCSKVLGTRNFLCVNREDTHNGARLSAPKKKRRIYTEEKAKAKVVLLFGGQHLFSFLFVQTSHLQQVSVAQCLGQQTAVAKVAGSNLSRNFHVIPRCLLVKYSVYPLITYFHRG